MEKRFCLGSDSASAGGRSGPYGPRGGSDLAPTPIGGQVRVRARLEEVDGRRLRFRVEAHDGDRLVGDGEHVRVVIDSERFLREAGG